uniref:Uncharacterized protein n=1 Tax=Ananas comosus var. bracteatus TaxID=296719 RepID=A0A6V7Q1M2_ANACO|nr:unnamed protein product [Ananas comosus var. bracteatus]
MDRTGPRFTSPLLPPLPNLNPNPSPSGAAAAAAAAAAPRHRRAHSDTFLRLPDDLFLDSDPDFAFSDLDFPSLSDDSGGPPPPEELRTIPGRRRRRGGATRGASPSTPRSSRD